MPASTTAPKLRCPHCAQLDSRPSLPRWWDRLFLLLGKQPYRCRSCRHRFHAVVRA